MLVHMFWRGPLSLYEQACMVSFVKQGFEVAVYTYDVDLPLPAGVQRRDARTVLPEALSTAFTQGGLRHDPAAFSDLFRYEVLFAQGGLWADADMLCLQPVAAFAALEQRREGRPLFAWEDEQIVNGALIMASPGCAVMRALADRAREHNPHIERWGEIGPHLITHYAQAHPEQVCLVASESFYPLHYSEMPVMLLGELYETAKLHCHNSLAVHLWNSFFRHYCVPKTMMPPSESFLYQQMFDLLGAVAPVLPDDTAGRLFKGTMAMNKLKNLKETLAQKLTVLVNDL